MTIDTVPVYLDEPDANPDGLKVVPVQIGDTVMAWRSPAVFSIAIIEAIDYGTGFETTAVTCRDVLTGEVIVNALQSVQTISLRIMASYLAGHLESWSDDSNAELLETMMHVASLLEPLYRATRLNSFLQDA